MLAGLGGERERVGEKQRARLHTHSHTLCVTFFFCAHVHVRQAIVSGWGHQSC